MSYAAVPPSPKKASAVPGPTASARTSASSPLLEDALRPGRMNSAGDATADLDIYEGGSATIFSSVSNLANTILGTGMLAFPYAFSQVGIVPGMISCATSGCTAGFGLYLLSVCAAEVRPLRASSFNAVSMMTFGPAATVFFDAAIAIKCFGVSCSYLIIVKTLTPPALTTIYNLLTSDDNVPPAILRSGPFWLLASMALAIPLSFFKRLDSLRFTSQAALVFILYMLAIVVWYFFQRHGDRGEMEPSGPVQYFRWSHGAIGSFPVQVFAFTCGQNLFPCFNELRNNTQRRMNTVIGSSIGGATIIYEILALAGYLTFGSNVASNILVMYPHSSLFVAIGRLGIVLMVIASYPLQVHPCRAAVDKILATVLKESDEVELEGVPDDTSDAGNDNAAGETGGGVAVKRIKEMGRTRFIALTAGIVTIGLAVALTVDELETVLSFVGATGSTIISFILPGCFYFKMFRKDDGAPRWLTWAAFALAIYGVCVMAFCLTYNVIRLTR